MAALANMSGQFINLHPYVSQRLISLFETLAKKHVKLETKIHGQSLINSADVVINTNGSVVNADLVSRNNVFSDNKFKVV